MLFSLAILIDNVYYEEVAQPAKKYEEVRDSADALALIEHIAKVLAEEYVALLREKDNNESSDLRPLLEREPERAKHR